MKKRLAAALAIASIVVSATMVYAGRAPKTGINGSLHDINAVPGYTNDTFLRTCVFCHTPHNALRAGTDELTPLWNHKDNLAAANGGRNFTPYQWISPANETIGMASDPLIGPTRLCMACHDGVTAVDAHGSAGSSGNGNTGMASTAEGRGWYQDALGNTAKRFIDDLQVTHPIGFKYSEAYSKRPGELVPPNFGFLLSAPTGENATAYAFDTRNRFAANGTDPLAGTTTVKRINDTLYSSTINGTDGYMTCATCHDVHNSVNAEPDPGTPAYNYFLYAKQEGSAICLSCHIK